MDKVNVFIKYKRKNVTNLDASKNFNKIKELAALKKYSSDGFERTILTRGSKKLFKEDILEIYNKRICY